MHCVDRITVGPPNALDVLDDALCRHSILQQGYCMCYDTIKSDLHKLIGVFLAKQQIRRLYGLRPAFIAVRLD